MFFRPRIGQHYQEGFKGYRTLVLGVKHHCTLRHCQYFEDCVNQRNCARYDTICPAYGNRHDLRLSHSNQIEIDAFLEEYDRYPAYSYFTKLMLNTANDLTEEEKTDFWEQVAFTNYLQYFLPNPQVPEFEEDGIYYREEDWTAFCELLDELHPEVLYVWNVALKTLLDKKIASGEIKGLEHFDVFQPETLTINRYLYQVEAKGEPETLFKNFMQTFCPNTDEPTAAQLMLNALQQARFRQFSPATNLPITPIMLEAVSGNIWDKNLVRFLIDLTQQASGLNTLADSFKTEISKTLKGCRVASSFAVNYLDARAIKTDDDHQAYSWFDLGKTCTTNDVDAIICYITDTNNHLKSLLHDLADGKFNKMLLLLPTTDSDKPLLDIATHQGLRRITEKNGTLLIELGSHPHDVVRLEHNGIRMDIRRRKLAQGLSLRPADYLSATMTYEELERLVFSVFHEEPKKIPTNDGEKDLAGLLDRLIDQRWLHRCGKRLEPVKGKAGQLLYYGLHQSGIPWKKLKLLFADENLDKNANLSKIKKLLEKNDRPTRYYKGLFNF